MRLGSQGQDNLWGDTPVGVKDEIFWMDNNKIDLRREQQNNIDKGL
jgi:hypothetical protein